MSRLPFGQAPLPSSPGESRTLGDSIDAPPTPRSVETVGSYHSSPFSNYDGRHSRSSGHRTPSRTSSRDERNVQQATSLLLLVEGLGTDENDKVQPLQLRKDRRRLRDQLRKNSGSEEQEIFGKGLHDLLAEKKSATRTWSHDRLNGGEGQVRFEDDASSPRLAASFDNMEESHASTRSHNFSPTEGAVYKKPGVLLAEQLRAINESQAKQTKYLEQTEMSKAQLAERYLRLVDQLEYRELSQHELAQRYSAQKAQLEQLEAEQRRWKRKYVNQLRAHKELERSMLDVVEERDSLLNTVDELQTNVSELSHFLDIAEAENASADRIADMAADNERLVAELEEARRLTTLADPHTDDSLEPSRLLSQISASKNTSQDDEYAKRVEDLRSQILARMLSATRDTEKDEEAWLLDARQAWLNSAGAVNGYVESATFSGVPLDHSLAATIPLHFGSATEYRSKTPNPEMNRPSSAPACIKESVTVDELHLHSPIAIPSSEHMQLVVGRLERPRSTSNANTTQLLGVRNNVSEASIWEVAEPSQTRPDNQMKVSFVSSVSIEPVSTRMPQTSNPSRLSMRRALQRDRPLSTPRLRVDPDPIQAGAFIHSPQLVREASWEKYRTAGADDLVSMPPFPPGRPVHEIASAPGSPLPSEVRDYHLTREDFDSSMDLRLRGRDTTDCQLNGLGKPRSLSEINDQHEDAGEGRWLSRHRRIQRSESHRTTATRDQRSESDDTSSHDSQAGFLPSLLCISGSKLPLNGEVLIMSSNPAIIDHQQRQEQERSRQKDIRNEIIPKDCSQNTSSFTAKIVPGWHINPETEDIFFSGSIGGSATNSDGSLEHDGAASNFAVKEPFTASKGIVSMLSSTQWERDNPREDGSETTITSIKGRGAESSILSLASGDCGSRSTITSIGEKQTSIHPHPTPPRDTSSQLLAVPHKMDFKTISSQHDQGSDAEDKTSISLGHSQATPSIRALGLSVRSMQTFFDSSNTRFRAKVLKYLDGLSEEITTPSNSWRKEEAEPSTAQILKSRSDLRTLPSMQQSPINEPSVGNPLSPIVEIHSEAAKSHQNQTTPLVAEDSNDGAEAAGSTLTDTGVALTLREKTHRGPDSTSDVLRISENGAHAQLRPPKIVVNEYGRQTVFRESSAHRTELTPSVDNAMVLYTGRRASTAIPSQGLSGMGFLESSTPSSNAFQSGRSETGVSDSMVLLRQESPAPVDQMPQLMMSALPEKFSQMLTPSHLAGSLRWHFPGFMASRDGSLWLMDFSNFSQNQQEAEELSSADLLLVNDGHVVTLVEEEDCGSMTDDDFHDWSSTSSTSVQWEVVPYHEIQDRLLVQFGETWHDTNTEHVHERLKYSRLPAEHDVASIATEENELVSAICHAKWRSCYSWSWTTILTSAALFIAVAAILDWVQMWSEGNDNVYWNAGTKMRYKYVWAIPWLERLKYQLVQYIGGSELIHEVYGF